MQTRRMLRSCAWRQSSKRTVPVIPSEAALPEEEPVLRASKHCHGLGPQHPRLGAQLVHELPPNAQFPEVLPHAHVNQLGGKVAIRDSSGSCDERESDRLLRVLVALLREGQLHGERVPDGLLAFLVIAVARLLEARGP